ncbi:histidinol-phosphatase [Comamonadaceae bacterium PP-2]
MTDFDELRAAAQAVADAARAETMTRFRQPLAVERKADDSPVTVADREAEAAMRRVLAERYPGHGVLGEEQGAQGLEAGEFWVLDPIDGTKSYVSASPLWGTLVAHCSGGQPVLGLVDMPVLGERWIGQRGRGASCNGQPVHTRACGELGRAWVSATSPDMFNPAEWQAFDALSRRAAMRRFGGDCYAYAQLAGGHLDAVIESNLQPYDYLPLVCLVEEAGGCITDWLGRPLRVDSTGQVVASATPELHAELLAALAAAAQA